MAQIEEPEDLAVLRLSTFVDKLSGHREDICNIWSLLLVVAEGHTIWDITERLFTARGCYSLLWATKFTTFEKFQCLT